MFEEAYAACIEQSACCERLSFICHSLRERTPTDLLGLFGVDRFCEGFQDEVG